MIPGVRVLCVCLNPAIDITYALDTMIAPGQSHRINAVRRRAGGKAINVARVLHAIGVPSLVLAPIGGPAGETIRSGLDEAGLESVLVGIEGTTRSTVAVIDPDDATLFNEPGPQLIAAEWAQLVEQFGVLAATSTVVVLSGSLPPGVPREAYRLLTAIAQDAGARVIVDAGADALDRALAARPGLVKPNLAELASISDEPLTGVAQIAAAGQEVRSRGAQNVVISCGRDGLVAVTGAGSWHAVLPGPLSGNPTGAGDALVAALAAGLASGRPWPELLRDGVALAAAAVTSPVAGDADPATAAQLRPRIVIQEIPVG